MSFETFIAGVLAPAKLGKDTLEYLLSESSIRRFLISFTHKSITQLSSENYELYELLGDSVINSTVMRYLYDRFHGKITSVDYLTKLKQRYISKEELSRFAEKMGFLPHIMVSNETVEQIHARGKKVCLDKLIYRSREIQSDENSELLVRVGENSVNWKPGINDAQKELLFANEMFISLLEDTFEAFIGTLQELIGQREAKKYPEYALKGMIIGPGHALAAKILYNILDKIEISLAYEDVYDPITRLKKLFDQEGGPRKTWQFSKKHGKGIKTYEKWIEVESGREIRRDPKGAIPPGIQIYYTTVVTIPLGQSVVIKSDESKIKTGKYGSEVQAVERALEYLKSIGIEEKNPPNPMKITN